MSTNPPPPRYASRYPYTITAPPGVTVRRLRTERGLTLRALSARCQPPTDHVAINRLEHNDYSQAVLERVAVALEVPLWVLFAPLALHDFARLSDSAQQRVTDLLRDIAAAERYRRSG